MSNSHSIFKRVFGIIDVVEDDKNISITGVKTQALSRELMKEWSTSRIESQMFLKFSSSRIVFPKFFALEMVYIIQTLINKKGTTNRRNLYKLLQELKDNTWLKSLEDAHQSRLDYSKLAMFHKRPLPHQDEFFRVYDENTQKYGLRGYLLSAAAGSGKTLTDLMLAEMLGTEIKIIVSPKNAIYRVWDDTLRNEYIKPQIAWIPDTGARYNGESVIVTHYEALDKVLEHARRFRGRKVAVILDESHNMNTPDSLRTLNFLAVCKETLAQDIVFASGTPIKAMGYEAIPLLRAIDPLFTPVVEERFKKIYGRTATRALDILAHRMGVITYKVDKKEVMDNKPTDVDVLVKLPNGNDYTLKTIGLEMQRFMEARMTHYQREYHRYRATYDRAIELFEKTLVTDQDRADYRQYQLAFDEICRGYDARTMAPLAQLCNRYELNVIMPTLPRDLKNEFADARSVIKYVELKVMGEALGGVLGKKRMQCHLDMIPHMGLADIIDNTLKKTVIFSSYVQVVEKAAEYLREQKYVPAVVHGETNKDLPEIIRRFDKDVAVNPLIATYQSLSTAVPLVMANAAVMTNQPWRDGEMIQARARIDRLSQDAPVFFYNVLLDTGGELNISTRSLDILTWSREQVGRIMGKPVDDAVAMEGLLDGPEDGPDITDMIGSELALEELICDLACEEGF